jgi:hypothetical protein
LQLTARAFALKTKVTNVFVVNVLVVNVLVKNALVKNALVLMVFPTVFSLRHEHKLRSINKYLMIQKKAIPSRSEHRLAESSITIATGHPGPARRKDKSAPLVNVFAATMVPTTTHATGTIAMNHRARMEHGRGNSYSRLELRSFTKIS